MSENVNQSCSMPKMTFLNGETSVVLIFSYNGTFHCTQNLEKTTSDMEKYNRTIVQAGIPPRTRSTDFFNALYCRISCCRSLWSSETSHWNTCLQRALVFFRAYIRLEVENTNKKAYFLKYLTIPLRFWTFRVESHVRCICSIAFSCQRRRKSNNIKQQSKKEKKTTAYKQKICQYYKSQCDTRSDGVFSWLHNINCTLYRPVIYRALRGQRSHLME